MMFRVFFLFGLLCLAQVALGCIQMDSFLFDSAPANIEDYDFLSEKLNGIPKERITSEMIVVGKSDERIHVVFVTADTTKIDPRIDPNNNVTVIFSHGNRGNISWYWNRIGYFEEMGVNVLTYDYRGYGASEGEASEEKMYQDVQAVYDYAVKRGAGPIFSVGYSMGGGPAIWLCSPDSHRKVQGCFIESAFASGKKLINDGMNYDIPGQWFTDFTFDNGGRASRCSIPFMIMHGTDDQRVAFTNAEAIWATVKDNNPNNQFYKIQGAGHRNVAVPSYTGEEEPREYSHPTEMPDDLYRDYIVYKGRIEKFMVAALGGSKD